jgi:APA family basic amino acid/polyamine antiporter
MTLRRTLGLWQVSITGVGIILGAGVYALVGPAAALAGTNLWLAFILAAIAAAFTAYSYARFAALRPKASPEFQYTELAFGTTAGFVAGWLMLLGDIAAAASVALGFGGYLGHLVGTSTVLGAALLVLGTALLMYAGIAHSVALAALLTSLEVAGLLFIIAVGIPSWPTLDFRVSSDAATGIFGAATLIFFAFLGFDELGNLAEEMRRPERDLPRALFIALGATTAIYVAVALSATAVVPVSVLGESSAPLALVAGKVLGPRAQTALALMALAATANTVLLLLLAAARSIYGMAGAGVLPRRLAHLTGTDVPREATLAVVVVAMSLIAIGDLSRAAHLTDALVLVSFAFVNAGLAWLAARGRTPGTARERARDVALAGAGALMCAWLLWHGGVVWIIAAAAVGAVGAAWSFFQRARGVRARAV